MNTRFLLMAEYETANIPLEKVALKYFSLDRKKMLRKAGDYEFPFPIFRAGTTKSEWMVSIEDLAQYLDSSRDQARKRFKALNSRA